MVSENLEDALGAQVDRHWSWTAMKLLMNTHLLTVMKGEIVFIT